jgi:tetratricopeptide (TPR) repeat protein
VGRPLAALIVCLPIWAGHAQASDFWAEVREPERRAFRQHVAEARLALRERRWADALASSGLARAVGPTRCEGPVLEGRAYQELGKHEEAVASYRSALDLDTSCFDAPDTAARAAELCAQAGEHALAARILQRVLARMEESPARRALFALYGDTLLTLGPDHVQQALAAYRQAVRHAPDLTATLGLALALRRTGAHEEALEVARAVAGHGRAELLVARLAVPEAEKAARRAVALEAVGDAQGARLAWQLVAREGALWRTHAEGELARLPGRAGDRP